MIDSDRGTGERLRRLGFSFAFLGSAALLLGYFSPSPLVMTNGEMETCYMMAGLLYCMSLFCIGGAIMLNTQPTG